MERIWKFIRNNPGFCLLPLLLLIIGVTSIKPDFYLLGWDNYSSYLHLPINIFRTFFATWREYRGLGVPSDSESTDIFRQLFSLFLKPIASDQTVDQFYMVASLWAGVLLFYGFAREYYKEIRNFFSFTTVNSDFFAFFASFFYLFNLNTLSVFYFPIIVYVTRFFAVPLILLVFYRFLKKQPISKKVYILAVVGIFISSGSYLTATVLITTLMLLGIFSLSIGTSIQKIILTFLFFFLLNAFWLLPFINYTFQKSSIIRLAPTFINANEDQLNKPKSFYSIEKQLTLYPNFFDTQYTRLSDGKNVYFHPLSLFQQSLFTVIGIWVFPFLYICGSVFLLYWAVRKKQRSLLWIPVTIGVFLFLSMKEYSFLGFLYQFLDKISPFFGVLFRFGDTKFHPYIALCGGLAAAFVCVYILELFAKHRKKTILLGMRLIIGAIIVISLIVYKTYFTGNLIGFFMYNQIPSAYFDIAKTINQDSDSFRVLQLPFDKEGYWRSYTWGYLGSSFFHFMINKPFIDKTFEPGSMENAYLDDRIYNDVLNAQVFSEENDDEKSTDFLQILRMTGVKYIIADGTISTEVGIRNALFWGKFNQSDTFSILNKLKDSGGLSLVKQYEVKVRDSKGKEVWSPIIVYKVNQYDKKISFVSQATRMDPLSQTSMMQPYPAISGDYYQQNNVPGDTYPFKRLDALIQQTNTSVVLQMKTVPFSSNELAVIPDIFKRNEVMIDVFAKLTQDGLAVTLYHRYLPDINGVAYRNKIYELNIPRKDLSPNIGETLQPSSYIATPNNMQDLYATLRLQVGQEVFPIPSRVNTEEVQLGSFITQDQTFEVSLLTLSQDLPINLANFALTQSPNCYQDALSEYQSSLRHADNSVTVSSHNGSTCVWTDLKPYIDNTKSQYYELKTSMSGSQTDFDRSEQNVKAIINTSAKPQLTQYVLDQGKLNTIKLCVKQYHVDDCLNSINIFNISGSSFDHIIPVDQYKQGIQDLLLLVTLQNQGYQTQELTVHNLNLLGYKRTKIATIAKPNSLGSYLLNRSNVTSHTMSIGVPKSNSAFSLRPDSSFSLSNKPCTSTGSYRTFREIPQTGILSYLQGCDTNLSLPTRFDSDHFYLWSVAYNLLSGKFPRFVVNDGFTSYKDQYISLYQGYPDISGFKQFENPEMPFQETDISQAMSHIPVQEAYTFINSQPGLHDTKSKNISIQQDSENEGIYLLKNFQIIPIPNSWENLYLTDSQSKNTFKSPKNYSIVQLLPSLWKVRSDSPITGMMYFNEGFDSQWESYGSIKDLIFGHRAESVHAKCNGYANCFVFDSDAKSNSSVIYLFYTPEKLSFLGWAVAILCGLFFGKALWTKKRNTEAT